MFIAAAPYCAEAQALFRVQSPLPDHNRRLLFDTLIRSLKTNGIWPKLGGLYVFAQLSQTDALRNLKSPSNSLTTGGTLTFTADEGITGNGVDGYVALGIPNTWTNFAQDDAHFGFYLAARNDQNQQVGDGATPRVYTQVTNALFRTRLNDETNNDTASAVSSGHWCCSRQSSASYVKYIDGAAVATANVVSVGVQSVAAFLLRHSTAYSAGKVSAFHYGAGLSGTEVGNLNSALNTLLGTLAAL